MAMSTAIASKISNNSTTIAIIAGVMMTPMILASVLSYFRTLRPPQKPCGLSDGVDRTFTASGLELLVAKPHGPNGSKVKGNNSEAPLLLVHVGYGTALCYREWLPYMSRRGRFVYSVSLRGQYSSSTLKSDRFLNISH